MSSTFRIANRTLVVWVGLGMTVWSSSRSQVQAQHTPDPFNIVGEYNRQYEPYMYASEPNGSGVFPNQTRLEERTSPRGPNRYQQYLDELDEGNGADAFLLPGRARGAGAGMTDAQASRAADLARNRMYRPNAKADKDFYSDQRERDLRYFEALGQSDPAKRAQMLREFRASDSRSARGAAGKASKNPRETRRLDGHDSRFSDLTGTGSDDMTDNEAATLPNGSGTRRSSAAPAPSRTRSRVGALIDAGRASDRSNATGTSARSPLNPRPGSTSSRASSSATAKPSDVLRRSRALDRDTSPPPSSGPIDPRTLETPPR
jgi:hypothetical protein